MPLPPSVQPRRRVRVVLSSTALEPFISIRHAAAPVVAQLGISAFFVAGLAASTLGGSAGWFVLAACLIAAFVRTVDIETWGLLLPGGFAGVATRAFGNRAGHVASAAALVERLLVGALAAVVAGHYLVRAAVTGIAGVRLSGFVRPEDLATIIAVFAVGLLWVRVRIGRDISRFTVANGIWIGGVLVIAAIAWALARLPSADLSVISVTPPYPAGAQTTWPLMRALLTYALGFAVTLPVLGGGEVLARSAHEFAPPRIQALKRVALLSVLFTGVVATLGTFLFVTVVPAADQALWLDTPMAGVASHLSTRVWLNQTMVLAVATAAVLMLLPVVDAAVTEVEAVLQRASFERVFPRPLASLPTRLGVTARAFDLSIAATVLTIVVSGGRVPWLARAYATALAVMLLLKLAAVLRLRRVHRDTRPFVAPFNLRLGERHVPLGLVAVGAIAGVSALALLAVADAPSLTAIGVIAVLTFRFARTARERHASDVAEGRDTFDLLRSAELSLDQIDARPGNVLIPVRNPHALGHVAAALRSPDDRDVVVMTVRIPGVDVSEESASASEPTAYERHLLSQVVALAERYGRSVRLLIVPARDVVGAIVATVLRIRSSDVYVGESASLSSADQARMLGEAWERADKPEPLDVRLVVHHRSGRDEVYHLGAHQPSLTPRDLDSIHRMWLDAVKTVGSHVRHRDIVRAALRQMEQQLTGPDRDDAITAIREAAQPAEELAAVVRAKDYTRLRDMLRNRHASDVAALLTALPLEDQVVVFRVLPRKAAAAVFEYLAQDDKSTLLKAMAQEDVAALLNNMAPDDRTLFLEELPAEATRQLLTLLTPGERSVAVTLLGYPEKSVGRLMTPHYVAVHEQWTVREVLDYVRVHGQDSETLNVIYVVDDEGLLIDDIRIREFLLAPLENRVADLMDRRFVALKATDDQEGAVAIFRQYDRSALPVTDTAGMLIGIVTIDDVLDVAEATATREIQRIGGSEALDEPYMTIAFSRMVQKRAGWLTALFIGEMLTATAMGAFQAEISKAVVLALFVPLIISSGGNSGSQAATLVIRALALGEVGIRDWWRVARREVFAGLCLGAILGGIGFLRITLWSAFSDIYGPQWLLVAVTVAVSLVGVVLWGTLSGSLLPFLLKRLGFDPAASSAPFVATLVDVTGLVIYFSVGLVVLRGTLL